MLLLVPLLVLLLLQLFITLNAEFKVLFYLGSSCQCIVKPVALSGHLYCKY
jgi:hypothetical protein